jgi:hypothetical protein
LNCGLHLQDRRYCGSPAKASEAAPTPAPAGWAARATAGTPPICPAVACGGVTGVASTVRARYRAGIMILTSASGRAAAAWRMGPRAASCDSEPRCAWRRNSPSPRRGHWPSTRRREGTGPPRPPSRWTEPRASGYESRACPQQEETCRARRAPAHLLPTPRQPPTHPTRHTPPLPPTFPRTGGGARIPQVVVRARIRQAEREGKGR